MFDLNKSKKQEWVDKTLEDLSKETKEAEANGGKMHPLQLALDVQDAIGEKDWLVIDGGNTHFWSEIAINIAGSKGKKIGGILHPGTFSMLGVGVPFALSAKNINPDSNVILISGDGAFLSGGISLYDHKYVKIMNSFIHHNSADDGLNIKNSSILLDGNTFSSNSADQVDLDFCEGVIRNNKFIEDSPVGNYGRIKILQDSNGDGLDLSGSKVLLSFNEFNGFSDKGISIGENTKAMVFYNSFNNNRSAITAKDQSNIYIGSNTYSDNSLDIEMYQKKKIFNHPSIYNINEKHDKTAISKDKKSRFFKLKDDLDIEQLNSLNSFEFLKNLNWEEYE